MTDTLFRQIRTLKLIPRGPQKVSVKDLLAKLADEGFKVTRRSVERDLVKLAEFFPIETDNNKPAGWWWNKHAAPFQLPELDLHAAVTLSLVEQQLSHLLPRSTLRYLEPQFAAASQLLSSTQLKGLPTWPELVRALPRSQPQLAPEVSEEVVTSVYEALLHRRQLKISYEPRQGEPAEHVVHPLGVVFRDGVGYLVCTYFDYDDVRSPVLHRVSSAEVLSTPCQVPAEFSLDSYLASGQLGWQVSPAPIKLAVLVAPDAAPAFLETPLATEQVVASAPDGRLRVEAPVADTRVLRSWLCSFGAAVEVEAPGSLREEIAARLRGALARYSVENP